MDNYITFPNVGNYRIPIERLLNLTIKDCKIKAAPPITKKTLELGSRYSPDFVCVPFKYNLGNYIEALEDGANILIQMGGGCRYGYYGEIQEQILKDLGWQFEFINMFTADRFNISTLYNKLKKLGCRISITKFTYYLLLIARMITIIDKTETFIRENIGFEVSKHSFNKLHQDFLSNLKTITSLSALNTASKKYAKQLKSVELNRPKKPLKVGIVGELYTLMEPFSNFYLEKELAQYNVSVSRHITISFLLFRKPINRKRTLKRTGGYLKYDIGADGMDSVADSKEFAKNGYDGIIHIKPFGCTPEVNAMPALLNIGRDYKIPIMYLSLDSQTSETGIKTRLEAFYDMIVMRHEDEKIF